MAPGRRLHWAWIVLAACFADLFINYSIRLGYGVVLPEMIRDLGLSRTAGGTIFNAYLLVYIALTPLSGYLTDRLGARRVVATCSLLLGAGVLWLGSADSLLKACLAFALVGLGATGMWTPVITVVQRWFAPQRRGLALGILSTGYGLGFAVTGLAFPWIVAHFDWRFTWYFLGAGALAMVAANGLLLRSDPESAGVLPWGQREAVQNGPAGRPADSRAGVYGQIFRDKTFWLVGTSFLCISYSVYGLTTFMVDYARYQIGLPLGKASFLATVHGLGQIVGVLTILPLSDRLGRRRTIILCNASVTAAMLGVVLWGGSWLALAGLIGFAALFYGAIFPSYGACAGDYFPREVMGTVIGAWTPFYGLGAISVHWISGLLRDATGSYGQAFLIDAAAAALGLILILRVRKGTGPG